jgi:hypothetical protein
MSVPSLPMSVLNLDAERPPKRQLEVSCRITNPASFDICILDVWAKVETLSGLKLAEGKIFQSMYNRIDPAVIPPGKDGLGAIHIDLPMQVLHHIEERRAGGDVKLRLSSRVLVSEVLVVNDIKTLGVPFETQFGNDGTGRFDFLIPQSEWIKLLKGLAWSELEILEVPSSGLRSIPPLVRGLKRFENAQECYRNGDWEEAMLNCRKAFEAIVQDASGESNMSKAHQVFVSIIGEGDKADRFDKLAKSLGEFLHLGRHENLPHISIKRADSELALRLTGAMLAYLGQHKKNG